METNVPPTPAPRSSRYRFIVVFVVVISAYFGLATLPWVDRHVVLPVLEISAGGASLLLNLFGFSTHVEGVIVRGKEFSVAVRNGCDPLAPIALMVAAMLGFPASLRQRFLGMGVGAVILFVLNLIRVASLYLTGRFHETWFYSLHQEWWPAVFILVALLLWWGWLNWVRLGGKSPHA
jgi:exosortase/archaeosortase family protein